MSLEKQKKYLSLLNKGFTAEQIACKIDPAKGRRYRKVKGQVQRVAAEDQEFLAGKAGEFTGGLAMQLPQMGEALARRARRGRVDAIKLALEVTGVHNPRVKHEHSGDITISMNSIPRPPRADDETVGQQAQALEDGTIVDATVVEEE